MGNNPSRDPRPDISDEEINAPRDFICPILKTVMHDPVVAADGFSYEREAIERWLAMHPDNARSPMTGAPLANRILVPNQTLKNMINAWRERPEEVGESAAEIANRARQLEERIHQLEGQLREMGLRHIVPPVTEAEEDESAIIAMCRVGDMRSLRAAIERDPRKALDRDSIGRTALYVACEAGREDVVRYLLTTSAVQDIRTPVPGGYLPIHIAAQENQVGIVQALVAQGADLLATDEHGRDTLYVACRYGRVQVAEFILGQERVAIDVRRRDDKGETAFFVACREAGQADDRIRIIRHLLMRDPGLLNIKSQRAGEEKSPLEIVEEKLHEAEGHHDTEKARRYRDLINELRQCESAQVEVIAHVSPPPPPPVAPIIAAGASIPPPPPPPPPPSPSHVTGTSLASLISQHRERLQPARPGQRAEVGGPAVPIEESPQVILQRAIALAMIRRRAHMENQEDPSEGEHPGMGRSP